MKKILLFSALVTAFGISGFSQDTLFTSTIVKLYEHGINADLILQEIAARKCVKFGMFNIDTLVLLKKIGLPANIQAAMINREEKETRSSRDGGSSSAAATAEDKEALTGLGYGIYARSGSTYVPLQSTVVSSNRQNSFLHNNISGFIPTKVTGVIVGSAAPISFKGKDTLYFVLQNANGTLAGSSILGATSPNDLVLIRLTPKKKTREMSLSKGSIAGQPEINPRDAIPFVSEPIKDGIFRVFVRAGLESGQYCFIPASGMARIIMDKVYDFGITN